MTQFFSSLVNQSIVRAKESTLSVLGISNPNLRDHLSEQMQADSGTENAFLATPVFEHTFGWEFAEPKIHELSGKLLSKEVVNALDSQSNGRYRFNADYQPFKHQLKAWKTLMADTPKSVVVTSGTGSGKTECFMVPVIDDLYREFQRESLPLVGVRAIFLYPLNALINSQQERLDAWTKHFGKGVRYCLYNGNTENFEKKRRAEQKEKPNEVLTRELMRKEPAPILVTNGTMLEYMLVRQVDSPIIEKSKAAKSLRWIVLDEAHTYVGSQAAELALQLRRVLMAFGVEAKNVRFVATSATIAGAESEGQLKTFLAELAGISEDQIVVIGGNRSIPDIEKVDFVERSIDEMESIELEGEIPKNGKRKDQNPEISLTRFNALSASKLATQLRDVIVNSHKPQSLEDINKALAAELSKPVMAQKELLRWLDITTGTKADASSQAFIKLRIHLFQRMTQGLWCCIDSSCKCKKDTHLESSWPFGYVYSTQRQDCECGAPVLELTSCLECNEPHLLGKENRHGQLTQWSSSGGNEFSLHQEVDDEDEITIQQYTGPSNVPVMFSALADNDGQYVDATISQNKEISLLGGEGFKLFKNEADSSSCAKCAHTNNKGKLPFRRALLGAPFYVANVVPTLLEFCPDFIPDKELDKGIGPNSLPGRGRRLITFTDSRQGTARMAVRMQQEAERSKLRGAVFEILREAQQNLPQNEVLTEGVTAADLSAQAATMRTMGMAEMAVELENRAKEIADGVSINKLAVISWVEMVGKLAKKPDIKDSILLYNKYLSPEVFDQTDGAIKLAEMMLFREFARRPKRQNSSETQGIIKVSYQGLERILTSPQYWENYKFEFQDWQDFIKVALDFFIRENSYLKLEEQGWKKWIGNKFSSKAFLHPESREDNENRIKKWPQVNKTGQQNRLVKLLLAACDVDIKTAEGSDIVNYWLKEAWLALTEQTKILTADGNQFSLDRHKLTFSFVDKVYICPVTNKLLDTTFKSFTPYLPRTMGNGHFKCESVKYPQLWLFNVSQEDYQPGLATIREQVANTEEIVALRQRNLWTDINDRAVEGGFYYRTAEHSAQQSSERLDDYEEKFKRGKINVLNCSTTMEMGVDIGGISAVVMNNVPPHPANYLQRAGRAGRSQESRAISYTLCKGNPHDQQVFLNPKWPFETLIPAPYVAFNSSRLVQRHVNSMLLSIFLREVIGNTKTEKTSLNLEWFYLNDGQSICQRFMAWAKTDGSAWDKDLTDLARGTALAGVSAENLRVNAIKVIKELEGCWLEDYNYLMGEKLQALEDSPYEYRLSIELTRLCKEYLLRELASKSFLPGYGFPTDVVNFDNNNIEDFIREKGSAKKKEKDREDNVSRVRGLPSRNLAIAIREYSPGSEVVLDGRVFRSGGVSLNWHNIADTDTREAQKFDLAWRCDCCGQTGYISGMSASNEELHCENPVCHKKIKLQHQLKVLQPAGFVTDFYESPSNDISTQSYIPVEPAWVSIAAEKISLPNESMGYMLAGPNGTVFNHTSGTFGKGYALCLTCGRADSLDGNGEFTKEFNPTKPHRPLRATKKDKDGYGKTVCDGAGTIMKDVHLGCHVKTDVFELVLKHPITNEYIPDNAEGHIIATTLAIALRSALAEQLGISTSEVGFACRPSIVDEGQTIKVIQLFDVISGGAGFSSSAPNYIQSLINVMYQKLICDSCQSSCSSCLLDTDSRHDVDSIDRLLALEWLGNDFCNFNGATKALLLLENGQYYPGSVAENIRYNFDHGVHTLTVWLNAKTDEWDLTAPEFRKEIIKYLTVDEKKVNIVLPTIKLGDDLIEELLLLKKIGVNFYLEKDSNQSVIVQLESEKNIITLANSNINVSCPSNSWHKAAGTVVVSYKKPKEELGLVNESFWEGVATNAVNDVELTTQLNGKLNKFGEAFWVQILQGEPSLLEILAESSLTKIHYTDRYLQSPSSLLLITQLLSCICKATNGNPIVEVETLFHQKGKPGYLLHHDWDNYDDFVEAFEYWIEFKSKVKPIIQIHEKRSVIAHKRKLTLEFDNGKLLVCRLDQGIGYWQLKDPQADNAKLKYDFKLDIHQNFSYLKTLDSSLNVKNSEQWSTDISYKLV